MGSADGVQDVSDGPRTARYEYLSRWPRPEKSSQECLLANIFGLCLSVTSWPSLALDAGMVTQMTPILHGGAIFVRFRLVYCSLWYLTVVAN